VPITIMTTRSTSTTIITSMVSIAAAVTTMTTSTIMSMASIAAAAITTTMSIIMSMASIAPAAMTTIITMPTRCSPPGAWRPTRSLTVPLLRRA